MAEVALDQLDPREARVRGRPLPGQDEAADREVGIAHECLEEPRPEPAEGSGHEHAPCTELHHASPRNASAFRRANAMMEPCGFTPGALQRRLASAR